MRKERESFLISLVCNNHSLKVVVFNVKRNEINKEHYGFMTAFVTVAQP